MRAQMLDGVEKLGLALSRGSGGVAVDKRAEVDNILLGIIPGRILRHVVAAFAPAGGIRLRATIGEQEKEKEIIAELILLRDLRDVLLNFPDAKRSSLGFILSARILWLEPSGWGWQGMENPITTEKHFLRCFLTFESDRRLL